MMYTKQILRTAVSAAALNAAVLVTAGTASATTAQPGDLWSVGASIIAPYWRVENDCLANPTQLIIKGTPPTFVTEPTFNYPGLNGSGAQDCSTTHIYSNFTSYVISATSGNSILTVFSHNPQLVGYINSAQTQYAPTINYGFSETPLTTNDVTIYNNGGTETQGSSSVVVVAPNVTPGAGQYANPATTYGPLVQFPVSIDPLPLV